MGVGGGGGGVGVVVGVGGGGGGVGVVVGVGGGGGASGTEPKSVFSVPSVPALISLAGSSDGSLTLSSDWQEPANIKHTVIANTLLNSLDIFIHNLLHHRVSKNFLIDVR